MDFRVLAVGDVVGNPGLEQIRRNLRQMKRQYHADFVVVNGNPLDDINLLAKPDAGLAAIARGGRFFKNELGA